MHCYTVPGKGSGSTLALVMYSGGVIRLCRDCEAVNNTCFMWKLELRISEIAYDGFSGIIQQTLVLQLPGLLDLFCCPA